MAATLRQRAKDLFLEAAELPPAERAGFVAARSAGEPELARALAGLLAAHARAEALGSTWPGASAGAASEGEPKGRAELPAAGARIGPYELVEEIGEGGFGVVWRAEQIEPVQRVVALKILRAGLATREVVARFAVERQALARMDHPCIARVFESGATGDGRPWFAMELVDGPTITAYCSARALGVRARLTLFRDVCRAVQHAHQKGVIHRDLKPSNVLVTEVDGRATPKVIDFGIAKPTDGALAHATLLTLTGQLVGTPAYMSPEQVELSADVDTRSDVYALGVLLYELLAGVLPFEGADAAPSGAPAPIGLAEVLRRIREVDPPKPSTRLMARPERAAAQVQPRDVRGDLDWIVMRCLEKDRERRYESVATLATEIERHLRGEPVLAGPPAVSYRMRKFARRHRAALAVTALTAFLLLGGIALALSQARRARAAERATLAQAGRTELELERAQAFAGFLEHVLLSVDPEVARGQDDTLLRLVLERAVLQIEREPQSALVEASVRRVIGGAYEAIAHFPEAAAQLERAYRLREAELGSEHPDTLQSLEEYASTLAGAGRLQEAEPLLAQCAAARRRLSGDADPRTLNSLNSHAFALEHLGRTDEALAILREVEAARGAALGPDHDDTLVVSNNLAGLLEDRGLLDEAIERYEHILAIQLERDGELHPRTLKTMNNLASAYGDVGRRGEAEDLLLRALGAKRQILEPAHPSILVTLNNLAYLADALGESERALAYFDEALALAAASPSAPVEQTLTLRYGRAMLLLGQGRGAEISGELESVLAGCLATVGPRAHLTINAQSGLAGAWLAAGRAEDALAPARAAVEAGIEAYGAEHASVAKFRARLGLVLAALGQRDEAAAELSAALAGLDRERDAALVALVEAAVVPAAD